MADPNLPVRHSSALPSVLKDVTADPMPAGKAWLGFEAPVIARKTQTVDRSAAYYRSREKQSDAYVALLDSRIRIAQKYAQLTDLPAALAEEQHQREHVRAGAAHRRVIDTLNAAHEVHLAAARHEVEIAKTREQGVRAQRNFDAARRVADVQVDQWYAQAAAQRNEAEATRQDTDADLQRRPDTASPDALKAAAADELAKAIATVEHQIELERERNNAAAVMALSNVRARLKSAA